MTTIRCIRCKDPVRARFSAGHYTYFHCGRQHRVPAKELGRRETDNMGTAAGAVVGLLGAIGTAINPLGAMAVGAIVGAAFNGDNSIPCHVRGCDGRAFPTGRRGRAGDPMYQCREPNCRAFTFRRK